MSSNGGWKAGLSPLFCLQIPVKQRLARLPIHLLYGEQRLLFRMLQHVVQKLIVEAAYKGVLPAAAIAYAGDFGPIGGAKAHGAGLGGAVQGAAR